MDSPWTELWQVIRATAGVVGIVTLAIGVWLGSRWKLAHAAEKARADSNTTLAKERLTTIEEERTRSAALQAKLTDLQGRPDLSTVKMLIETSGSVTVEEMKRVQETVAEQGRENLERMLAGVEQARAFREKEHTQMAAMLASVSVSLEEVRKALIRVNGGNVVDSGTETE